MTIEEPTVPCVACDVATVGFVVVLVELIDAAGLDVDGGSAGALPGVVLAVDVGAGSLEDGAVVVVVELEGDDDDDALDELELDDDDEPGDEAVLEEGAAATSAALSAAFVFVGDAAERIIGGVGTNRGACRGST